MKLALRFAIVPVALVLGYFVGMYLDRFTGAPLINGKYEGTPVTPIAFFGGFFVTTVIVLVLGNALISRYFKPSPRR